jgi:hypothetical protein
MSMQSQMQPIVIVGLAIFVGVQALTGFATGGANLVPSLKQHVNGAVARLSAPAPSPRSAHPLIAAPTGSAPRPIAAAHPLSEARTLDWNVLYSGGHAYVVAVEAAPACRALARRLLDQQLTRPLTLHPGKTDGFGRTLARVSDGGGGDIAQRVSAQVRARCA